MNISMSVLMVFKIANSNLLLIYKMMLQIPLSDHIKPEYTSILGTYNSLIGSTYPMTTDTEILQYCLDIDRFPKLPPSNSKGTNNG